MFTVNLQPFSTEKIWVCASSPLIYTFGDNTILTFVFIENMIFISSVTQSTPNQVFLMQKCFDKRTVVQMFFLSSLVHS